MAKKEKRFMGSILDSNDYRAGNRVEVEKAPKASYEDQETGQGKIGALVDPKDYTKGKDGTYRRKPGR
jgi:hypothetical protein